MTHASASAAASATPGATLDDADPRSARAIRLWMIASAAVVVLTLVVGGITRLTESGLSITEWKPVSGVLPPLTAAEWQRAYNQYLQIPEAQTVHQGITLEQFKTLFWWEWGHRLSARLAGLVLAVPFVILFFTRRLPRRLFGRLLALPLLTAAQGALGWYMVSSGLSVRTDVSQYRLVAHLALALGIYVIAVWTALTVGVRRPPAHRGALVLAALAFATILSGGFVAGLDAGHVYNTFPRMGTGLVPPGYTQLNPAWRNLFENAAAVQFNHRVLASLTFVAVVTTAGTMWRRRRWSRSWLLLLLAAAVQVSLGIATLLLAVPVPVAALHQLGAVLLLTVALFCAAAGQSSTSSRAATSPPSTSDNTREMTGAP